MPTDKHIYKPGLTDGQERIQRMKREAGVSLTGDGSDLLGRLVDHLG